MRRHKTARTCLLLITILFLLSFSPTPAWSEEHTLSKPPFPQDLPLLLEFEAYTASGLWSEVREDFRVHVDAQWPGGASIRYEAKDPDDTWQPVASSHLVNRFACPSLDPWWQSTNTIQTRRCELWLSRAAMLELQSDKSTEFAVDISERRDNYVALKLERRTVFSCVLNHKHVALEALVLSSTRGDELIVLDDAQNPLVLQITSSLFRWKLNAVTSE